MAIQFTQYLMPDGCKDIITIDRPPEIEEKAAAVVEAGFVFEAEMLSDYHTISLTMGDPEEEVDHFIELVPNGPKVLEAVDKLVSDAFEFATQQEGEGDG